MRDGREFQLYYDELRKKSDLVLNNLLCEKKPDSLYKPAAYIIESGGKRLRPLLVLFSVKASGGDVNNAYNAAAAVELLHNFTLVHDDIMDEADKRRGRPTLHKLHDLSTAILSGDSLVAISYEALIKDCTINIKEIVNSFTGALTEVCEGQSYDKIFESKSDVSIDEYFLMITKKTAALLEMCCTVGALIANADDKVVKGLASFGLNLGIAFQVQDDYLDIYGDEKELGKIPGGDIVQGKKSFLYLTARQKAGMKENLLLDKISDGKITYEDVPVYRDLFSTLGIPEEALKTIKYYSNKAISSLTGIKEEDRELFTWLTNTLITRNK